MTAKSTEAPALDVALKTLWGASRWPGMADGEVVLSHPSWQEAYRRLDQLVSVHASGVLHGPNGVGKSTLLHRWGERLGQKQYRFLRMAHGSLAHSDLLRHLVTLGGRTPQYRKGDNVMLLSALWQEWAPAWPILKRVSANLRISNCSRWLIPIGRTGKASSPARTNRRNSIPTAPWNNSCGGDSSFSGGSDSCPAPS